MFVGLRVWCSLCWLSVAYCVWVCGWLCLFVFAILIWFACWCMLNSVVTYL